MYIYIYIHIYLGESFRPWRLRESLVPWRIDHNPFHRLKIPICWKNLLSVLFGMSCSHDWLPPNKNNRPTTTRSTTTTTTTTTCTHKPCVAQTGAMINGKKTPRCCQMCCSSCPQLIHCYSHLDMTNFIKCNVLYLGPGRKTLLTTNAKSNAQIISPTFVNDVGNVMPHDSLPSQNATTKLTCTNSFNIHL